MVDFICIYNQNQPKCKLNIASMDGMGTDVGIHVAGHVFP